MDRRQLTGTCGSSVSDCSRRQRYRLPPCVFGTDWEPRGSETERRVRGACGGNGRVVRYAGGRLCRRARQLAIRSHHLHSIPNSLLPSPSFPFPSSQIVSFATLPPPLLPWGGGRSGAGGSGQGWLARHHPLLFLPQPESRPRSRATRVHDLRTQERRLAPGPGPGWNPGTAGTPPSAAAPPGSAARRPPQPTAAKSAVAARTAVRGRGARCDAGARLPHDLRHSNDHGYSMYWMRALAASYSSFSHDVVFQEHMAR